VIINTFLANLQKLTGATVKAITLANDWAANPPAGAPKGVSLSSYLNITYPIFISKEQIALVRTPFYSDYAGMFCCQHYAVGSDDES
jgi:hypothetical protein